MRYQTARPGKVSVSNKLSQLYFDTFLTSQETNLEWFPRMRAMSLVSNEGEGEQNEMRCLQEKLDDTLTLVAQLSAQLSELKEQVDFYFLSWN